MSSLKIASLDIRDFRGIRQATIDCNADVVLIYGRNGAGKTTIFDAIEYALFGGNRRLEDLAKDSKERWEDCLPNKVGDGSFDLALHFQTGETIEVHRSADGEESGSWVGQNRRDFVYRRLLKNKERGRRNVAAMHDLALATHLLLQSEIAGFAASGTLDAEKLAALTGSGYNERCRGKAGEALTNARRRYKERAGSHANLVQQRDEAARRVERITASLARRDELIARVRAHGVHFQATAVADGTTSVAEWADMLGAVRRAVAAAGEEAGLVRALSEMSQEGDDEAALRRSIAVLRELASTTQSRRAALEHQLAAARELLDKMTHSQTVRAQRHTSAERLLRDISQLQASRTDVPRLVVALEKAKDAERGATSDELAAKTDAENASAALAAAVDEHARLQAHRSYVADAAEARARAAAEQEQIERSLVATRVEVTRASAEMAQAKAVIDAARTAFNSELQRFINVAPDVDRLAAELQALIANESDCPLCGSSFGSPSALTHAITEHGNRRSAALEAARDALQERRTAAERAENTARRAEAALAALTARVQAAEAGSSHARTAREVAEDRLTKLTNGGSDVSGILNDLSTRVDAASARVDDLRKRTTEASARLAATRLSGQNAAERLAAATYALDDAQRKSASLESAVTRAATELHVAPDVDAIRTLASTLDADLRTRGEQIEAQRATVHDLAAELTRSSEEFADLEARLTAENGRLQQAIQRREIRTGQLARLRLAPTASGEEIAHAGAAARQREARLRELAIMVSELVDIANSGTVGDLGAAREALANYEREVSALQQELAALQSVGTTLKTWQELLRSRVEAAVHDFVLPRAAEIEDTFRSLVADPLRFKKILVERDEAHGGLRLGLVFRNLDQASGSPEFFLSAAQMSALALAIFLSLARSQTWSWLDTILLDDPVQHLDDLDCIALLDGLRNVARQSRSKQLIISTCDRSLYHHMIRKFSLAAAPAESTLLAIRLEEDLANGVRLHYEVDSRRGGAAAAGTPGRNMS